MSNRAAVTTETLEQEQSQATRLEAEAEPGANQAGSPRTIES
ncbi:hypothetical protein [Kibdelosporangium philippinense]